MGHRGCSRHLGWEEAITLINEAVARKAEEANVSQGRFEKEKIDEDISSEDGQTVCFNCKNNLECKEHRLHKFFFEKP